MDVTTALKPILDSDEQVLWQGVPTRAPSLLRGIPFLFLCSAWVFAMVAKLYIIPTLIWHRPLSMDRLFPFIILSAFLLLAGLLNMFRLYVIGGRQLYAITNKRLIKRLGFWSVEFQVHTFDKIIDSDVRIGILGKLTGTGTIVMRTSLTGSTVTIIHILSGIPDPYGAYKKLHELAKSLGNHTAPTQT